MSARLLDMIGETGLSVLHCSCKLKTRSESFKSLCSDLG
jgi:hypothetical protein